MMKTLHPVLCLALLSVLALATPAIAQSTDSIADAVTKFDTPPKPLKTKPPQYPDKLRSEGVSGVVVVKIVIDVNGKVIAQEVAKTSNEAFNGPALEAVRNWVFEPAAVAGKAVRAKVSVPLKFEVEA